MALADLFGKWFGGSAGKSEGPSETAEPVEYKGFTILPTPIREGGQFRVSGLIRHDREGQIREKSFIRADNSTDREFCVNHAVLKARQIIDEQGESLFDRANI